MKDLTKKEIDTELMQAGYLCPDYSLHEWKLLEWEENIRKMKCDKCGNITVAMAKSSPLKS